VRLVYRITSITLFLYSVAACSQQAQTPKAATDQLIIEMLKLRAPAPPMGVPGQSATETSGGQPASFTEPAEDAPLDVLGRFWAQLGLPEKKLPSAKVRLRLLDFCETHPEFLSDLLKFLPTDSDSNARVTCRTSSADSCTNSSRKCRMPAARHSSRCALASCASAPKTVLRQPTSAITGCARPLESFSATRCFSHGRPQSL